MIQILTKREELLVLLEQKKREQVSPKLEAFRKPARVKLAKGGRGAGAKSWSVASLILQRATYEKIHIACLREVQLTLEESVWKLLNETIERLKYTGWKSTRESINHTNGSHIIFRGISDLRADQIKSLESFDIFWIEEAQGASEHSLDILLPTLRKPGSELWATMNPDEEIDPIIARLWNDDRKSILVDLLPGKADNPWWTKELQIEMEADFKRDPDLAEHIWNGAPRFQGSRSIMSRKAIRAAMDRDLPTDKKAITEIGIDVARFGDDSTVFVKRQGTKVVCFEKYNGIDTQETARKGWDMAGRSDKVKIKVDDDGVGGGVTDKLKDLGAYVVPVHNGATAWDTVRYTTCADEQWFGLSIDEIDIPNDNDLMAELSGRQYKYTTKDQRKIESKADFKKRYGHSPDSADALLLAFYQEKQGRIADNYSASDLGL